MHYLIYIFVTLLTSGPRAGYPTVTREVRLPARQDSVQVIYYDSPMPSQLTSRAPAWKQPMLH